MNKVLMLCISLIFASYTNAQTVEQIINTHLKTVGTDKLETVKTIVMKGSAMQVGMEFPFASYMKRADNGNIKSKSILDFQGQTLIPSAFDGKQGWKKMPGISGGLTVTDLSAEELRPLEERHMEGPFFRYKEREIKLKRLSDEKFDNKNCYVIERTDSKTGQKSTFYISKAEYVIIAEKTEVESNGQKSTVTVIQGQYDLIEGIAFPFLVETRINGQTIISINFERIDLDEEIEDELFKRPN
jgi:hypothetical protein